MTFIPKSYSRYVTLMKAVLPIAIFLSVGLTILWPYLQSLNKENFAMVDPTQPEIRENRMVRPHYMSTDEKGQPFHVDAEWAKHKTENLADLVSPHGSIALTEGQTFDLTAQEGHYDSEAKVLELEGNVRLKGTDGYDVQTSKARITLDNKVIDGSDPVKGDGPTGEIMAQEGFRVESRPHGKKVITLKGRSRVVIKKTSALKKPKETHEY